MIETMCPLCRSQVTLDAAAVIVGRRLPVGDGTATFRCTACRNPVCLVLTEDEVMTAVFAGALAVDVETVP